MRLQIWHARGNSFNGKTISVRAYVVERGREMYAKWHFAASLVIAGFSLFFNQDTPFLDVELFSYDITVFVLCIMVGVFVDVDHVIDILKGYAFKSVASRFREGRLIILFHGIENAVILTGLSIVFPFLIFPSISYICHIMMDVYGNNIPFRAYFYVLRVARALQV